MSQLLSVPDLHIPPPLRPKCLVLQASLRLRYICPPHSDCSVPAWSSSLRAPLVSVSVSKASYAPALNGGQSGTPRGLTSSIGTFSCCSLREVITWDFIEVSGMDNKRWEWRGGGNDVWEQGHLSSNCPGVISEGTPHSPD